LWIKAHKERWDGEMGKNSKKGKRSLQRRPAIKFSSRNGRSNNPPKGGELGNRKNRFGNAKGMWEEKARNQQTRRTDPGAWKQTQKGGQ